MTFSTEIIHAALSGYRFSFSDEYALQAGIALALEREGIASEKEYRLTPQDRLDFFCDGVVVECKIAGTAAALIRQIHRYAQHEDVRGIVVVTNRARHCDLPDSLNGKPILVCSLLVGGIL